MPRPVRIPARAASGWVRGHARLTAVLASLAAAGLLLAALVRARRADAGPVDDEPPGTGAHRFGPAEQMADGAAGATPARTAGMGG